MTFINGCPYSSTGSVTDHMLVTAKAIIALGYTLDVCSTCFTQAVMLDHHSAGSCSAPPSGRKNNCTGAEALATTFPSWSTRPTLGPPVPRSITSTHLPDDNPPSTMIGPSYCVFSLWF